MIDLIRYNYADTATQGVILLNGKYICDTLELPWKDNVQFISCIPDGIYPIQWTYQKHDVGDCYEIGEVKDREGILMHPANLISELQGCIAPGDKYGDRVLASLDALKRVLVVAGPTNYLKITNLSEIL